MNDWRHTPVVIMAGGRGSRIASISGDLPKPMLSVCGKPVLAHQIEVLRGQGVADVTITTGYGGKHIHEYFRDGADFGVRIAYHHEETPLGSGGALLELRGTLPGDFVLINGDVIFDIDLKRMLDFHKRSRALATLAAHPNSHPHDSALLVVDSEMRIVDWLHKEDARDLYHNRVNAGIHVLSPRLLEDAAAPAGKVDLDRDILKPAVGGGGMFAYDTPEYIHDMGTPERYEMVSGDVRSGRVAARNMQKRQKAVFLDRDGVINVHDGHIAHWRDLRLLPGAAEAIRTINRSRYLAIVITNQPVVARGECDFDGLDRIHQRLAVLLGREGAYLDALFFCPHHPDSGFPGERRELKVDCDCRKPKAGLFFQAARQYNISLADSFMIGDSLRDVEAARNAGVVPVFVGDKPAPPGICARYAGLYEAVASILHVS